MTISETKATRVRFDADSMWVQLSDGRELGVPLAWFPRLLHATPEQRQLVRISARGLHWEALDEDISVAGLLAGLGDQTRSATAVALKSCLNPSKPCYLPPLKCVYLAAVTLTPESDTT